LIVLDDIVTAPGKGIMWIFRSVHRAVKDEMANERKNLKAHLSELYQQLERGELTEEEFDEKEGPILDRLDELKEEEEG
jgi:hypothetical protein